MDDFLDEVARELGVIARDLELNHDGTQHEMREAIERAARQLRELQDKTEDTTTRKQTTH